MNNEPIECICQCVERAPVPMPVLGWIFLISIMVVLAIIVVPFVREFG